MTAPSIQRAAALSFFFHAGLFILLVMLSQKTIHPLPEIYSVELVPMESVTPYSPPAAEDSAPEPSTAEPGASAPASQPAPSASYKDAARQIDSLRKQKDSASTTRDSIETLRQQRQHQQDVQGRLEELARRKRLEALRSSSETSHAATESERANELDKYLVQIRAMVLKNWVFPDIKNVSNYRAVVSVIISDAGAVEITKFEEPSGNALFDRSAVKAITKTRSVPPPPFGEAIEIGIRFQPNEK